MSDLKLTESVASRGNSLVLFAPPVPSLARPLLSGLLQRLHDSRGRALALVPSEALEVWAEVAAAAAASKDKQVGFARTPARLSRLINAEQLPLLLVAPDTAFELVRRGALKLDSFAAILLLWPEAYPEELVTTLLQDIPKETQRILVSSDPGGSAGLVERQFWRAAVTDLLGSEPLSPSPPVRSIVTSWSRRIATVLDLVEQLDPGALAVSVSECSDAGQLQHNLAGYGISATVGSGPPSPETANLIIAYDLPSPTRLRELAAVAEVVLLVPPGTEVYVNRLAPTRRPLQSLGALETAQAELGRTRRTVVEAVERAAPESYAALAPLFERLEATAVAAGLYELWQRQMRLGTATIAPPRLPPAVQLWVNLGKRDGATPHDLVAILMKESGVPKDAIGKLEIRESFSLVQLATAVAAEAVAEKLTGKVVRKRRLVARVDRGRR